ncbi:DNA alkylation repair protein [Methylophaga sp. OBS3]|uniref:DNA alkylation repair protein n=1 Tax=Methylophaga sp. OBS3 TaxID=2991934 RepID=UPI00225904F8|nr:DNA alkylation repair protein [Methylophaga sp. OBS3]MCX4190016.1 DNA alkylation repair protein [Methylophaga sp. OBS3]
MAEPLKYLINTEAVKFLGDVLVQHFQYFDAERFTKQASAEIDDLSLTQRVDCLAELICEQLDTDFAQVAPKLLLLAEQWQKMGSDVGWESYIAWPIITYAGKAGIKTPEIALPVLGVLTSLFTAEFAVRLYINEYFDISYQHMLAWAESDDLHKRRLASEGLRPRLPWGTRLDNIPLDKALELLALLRDDDSLYVRKSVANHLNDLSKSHPEKILQLCREWQKDATPVRLWIIGRALRTLQKQAHPEALAILGYQQYLAINHRFSLSQHEYQLGEAVELVAELHNVSDKTQSLLVDYELHLPRANGAMSSKVFFWQRLTLAAGESIALQKKQLMQQLSTRKLYPGQHEIRLRVNGQVLAGEAFMLK